MKVKLPIGYSVNISIAFDVFDETDTRLDFD
jgi:hypothetical protein